MNYNYPRQQYPGQQYPRQQYPVQQYPRQQYPSAMYPGRGSGIKDFLNSSSAIARFSFLLIVFLIFIILLSICMQILTAIISGQNNSPLLINGMVDANQMLVIPQDPGQKGAVTLFRSVNGPNGIEFTWSVWIYISHMKSTGQYSHIFSKGNANIQTSGDSMGLNFPNNAPGLYLSPNTNELTLIMNTYEVINEKITIPDIPVNKWINVIIRCRNKNIDVYINGVITRSIELMGVPKQNYGDVNVALNGGFSGFISNLQYFNYSLGTLAIQKLVEKGPNTKMSSGTSMSMKNPDYLSLRWYFYG